MSENGSSEGKENKNVEKVSINSMSVRLGKKKIIEKLFQKKMGQGWQNPKFLLKTPLRKT